LTAKTNTGEQLLLMKYPFTAVKVELLVVVLGDGKAFSNQLLRNACNKRL